MAISGIAFSKSHARNSLEKDVHEYVGIDVELVRGLMDQGTSVQ